jgi:hypothetical protein
LAGLVVGELHDQRVGNALHDAPVNLSVDDPRLEHVSAVMSNDPAQDPDGARVWIDLEHYGVGTVGEARLRHGEELRVLETERFARHLTCVRGGGHLDLAEGAARQPAHRELPAFAHDVGSCGFEQMGGDPDRLVADRAPGEQRGAAADRRRPAAVGPAALRHQRRVAGQRCIYIVYRRRVKGQRPSQRERLAAFRLAAFAAYLPRAVRVFFGRRVMVRFRFAALAALPIFLLAAAFCLAVAIIAS